MEQTDNWLIFSPNDVDLERSPLRAGLGRVTYVMGAFNPGMATLPNGNLILMVRIAEALTQPVDNGYIRSIRWEAGRYVLDAYPLDEVETDDPRKFTVKKYLPNVVTALTSLSGCFREISPDGRNIIEIHYDKVVAPDRSSQEYGIEDARISKIGDKYYMTACTVSSERHATTLFESDDGLNYSFKGIILDHQNKDMLLFNGKVGDKYFALTRPLGSLYFVTGKGSGWMPGPSINLAVSPDLLTGSPAMKRLSCAEGSASQNGSAEEPSVSRKGWLFHHGVEDKGKVGI
jgi:predicted GH43/DUF377 family glycosyl hydrolase